MVSGKGKGKGGKAAAKGGKGGKGGEEGEKGDLTKVLAAGASGGGSGRGGKSRGGKGGKGAAASEDMNAAKTVQELEAELLIARLSKKGGAKAEDGEKKQASAKHQLEAKGSHCEVRKHSDMGCAVVTMESVQAREVVFKLASDRTPAAGEGEREKRPQVEVGEFTIQLRPHFDKNQQTDIKTDIFVAWGRQNEKRSPLAPTAIAEVFDNLFREAQPSAAQVYGQQMAMAMHPAMMQPQMAACQHQTMQAGMMPTAMPYMTMQAPQYGMMHPHQVAQATMAQHATAMAQQQVMPMQQMQQQMQAQLPQQQQHLQQQQPAQLQAPQAVPQAVAGPPSTPPRGPSDAPVNGMRADAPTFTFPPTQSAPSGAAAFNGFEYSDLASYLPPTPERKALTIKDPKSGEPIKVDPPKLLPGFSLPKATGHKPLSIIDPVSGSKVDTIGMNFTPPKTAKLSIIDPSCGTAIKT